MKERQKSDPSVVRIDGAGTARKLRTMRPTAPIDALYGRTDGLFHAKLAREISRWPGIRKVELWSTVSKAAVRELLEIPELEDLFLLDLNPHGTLRGGAHPASLRTLGCSMGLTSRDLVEVSRLPGLVSLSAQNSHVSGASLEKVVGMAALTDLDLEASNLDDDMASIVATSSTLEELLIGATRLTARGLREICKMSQLRSLDIWALDITEADLELLSILPHLGSLSVGGFEGQTTLTADGVLPRLDKLPSLKRLWLDGIPLSRAQEAALNERYDHVQVT